MFQTCTAREKYKENDDSILQLNYDRNRIPFCYRTTFKVPVPIKINNFHSKPQLMTKRAVFIYFIIFLKKETQGQATLTITLYDDEI